jgi:Fe2+ or Zn2+ uptake regulation protein
MNSKPESLLRDHGVQVTAQRLAVLKAVSTTPHSNADAIAKVVRDNIGSISRQAVYDTLSMLVEKGLIRRIQSAGSSALYEDRVGDNHHHLICRNCGKTVDVACVIGQAPCLKPDQDAGFKVEQADVIFWGTCPECLNKHSSD